MSLEKVSVLAIGPGNIRNVTATSRLFSSNTQMNHWASTTAYLTNDCVESSGAVWQAIQASTNQVPTLNDGYWIVLFTSVHDGDIAVSTTGTIDIRCRTSGVWVSIALKPLTVPLIDNTVVATEIFRYSASSFKDAFIDYEIARANGKTEGGTLRILTDGTTSFNYSQESTQLIGDPQVTLSVSVDAGDIVLSYISANQTSAITFKYLMRGW